MLHTSLPPRVTWIFVEFRLYLIQDKNTLVKNSNIFEIMGYNSVKILLLRNEIFSEGTLATFPGNSNSYFRP